MKSVFLVKSPLQILNAIEAKIYFGLHVDECVLVVMGDRKSQPQMLKLINDNWQWAEIIILDYVGLLSLNIFYLNNELPANADSSFLNKSFFNVYKLNKISKYVGNARYIFIGYERSEYMRHFVNITKNDMTVLLDDGVVTIDIAKERSRGRCNDKKISLAKNIKLNLKRFLQGLKDSKIDSVCFFTAYDIEVHIKDKIIHHNYRYLRGNSCGASRASLVYFIGAPLSEAGIMSQKVYFEYLEKVKEYFKGFNVVYVAHRRESRENLNEIEAKLGFQVRLFDYPVEYQIIKSGDKPGVIASFVSSVLDSCRLIFGDEIKVISFRLSKGSYSREESVDMVYEYFANNISSSFSIESLG